MSSGNCCTKISELLLAFFLAGSSAYFATAGTVLQWKRLNPSGISPVGRSYSAVGFDSYRKRLVIFGGMSANNEPLADTWLLELERKHWEKTNGTVVNHPGAKYGAIFGKNQDNLIVAFGRGRTKSTISNEVYSFDYNLTRWSKISATGGGVKGRYFAAGGFSSSSLFVTHGHGESNLLSDTYRLDLKNLQWDKLHDDVNQYSPVLPHARFSLSGALLPGNKLLIFGGCMSAEKSAGPCPARDSWLFEADSKKWIPLESCMNGREFSAIAVLPNSTSTSAIAVLFGGRETGNIMIKLGQEATVDEIVTFDTKNNEWNRRSVIADPSFGFPEPRYGHVLVTTDDGIAIFGGTSSRSGGMLNDIWILKGDILSARNSPISGKCGGRGTDFILLHGIFMFFSWGVMIQLGAFIARYFKDKKAWYNAHQILAVTGLALSIIGFSLGIASYKGSHFSFVHGAIGLDIMLAGLYQPLNAIFRPAEPKEGEKPKLWRRIWEISHKFTGRVALLLALINISLGLFLNLASKAVWITWFTYLGIVVIVYVIAEIHTRKMKRSSSSVVVDIVNVAMRT